MAVDDLHARLVAEVTRRLAIARAATEGPWELGDVWLRAGVLKDGLNSGRLGTIRIAAGECAYCPLGTPAAVIPDMDVNGGRTMLGHVHRAMRPYDPTRSISHQYGVVLHGGGDDGPNVSPADAAHMVLHDPVDAIRRYEADLRRLERHGCLWRDCAEIRDVAASLGIDLDDEVAS